MSKELNSFLDNQLSDSRKAKVVEHLAGCKACSEELERLKAVCVKLAAWHAPEPGSSFESSVRGKIVAWELERGEVKMKKKTLAILVPSGVLAGILVFIFVGVMSHGQLSRMKASTIENKQLAMRKASGDERYYMAQSATARQGVTLSDNKSWVSDRNFVSSAMEAAVVSRGGTQGSADAYAPTQTQYADSGEGPVIVIQPTLPATGQGEKIIRTATVTVEVEDGKLAYQKALQICQELGGYMASSNFYKDSQGREAGTITMRIPKEKFESAVDKLGALGKVESSNTDSRDVSQEYANLKTQLDAAMVVYNKMMEALQKKQVTIPEAVRLESELTPILRRIQDLKNRLEYLDNAISYTTITVNVHEPVVSVKVLKDSKRQIKESLINTGVNTIKFIAGVIPVAVLLFFWLIILGIVAFLVKYLVAKLFKRA
jgi:hypothetical protein